MVESFKIKLDSIINATNALTNRTSKIERVIARFYNNTSFRRMPLRTQQLHTSMPK